MGPQKTGLEGTTGLSDYLPLAGGTRLAYDLILPAIGGRPSGRPLPALLKCTPYLRTYAMRGEEQKRRVAGLYRMPASERAALQDLDLFGPRHRSGWLAGLVQQGYAVIVVERPGHRGFVRHAGPGLGGDRPGRPTRCWAGSRPRIGATAASACGVPRGRARPRWPRPAPATRT